MAYRTQVVQLANPPPVDSHLLDADVERIGAVHRENNPVPRVMSGSMCLQIRPQVRILEEAPGGQGHSHWPTDCLMVRFSAAEVASSSIRLTRPPWAPRAAAALGPVAQLFGTSAPAAEARQNDNGSFNVPNLDPNPPW